MGATPVTALNLVSYPCKLGMERLSDILRGGQNKVEEAGAVVVGGHSVDDPEPKYGLAVTGVVDPGKMITNTGYYGAAGDKYVPQHAYEETVDQLADRWTGEWEDGIEGTGIRPGFIKGGVDGVV